MPLPSLSPVSAALAARVDVALAKIKATTSHAEVEPPRRGCITHVTVTDQAWWSL